MRNPSKPSSSTSGGGVAGAVGSKSSTSRITNKTTTPCCSKVGMKRGPWTPEEDELLANYIRREGEGRWRTMPKKAGLLRCGKSCRLRWLNYLRPSVKRGHIAPDEEDLILRLHRLLGNRWSLIAGRIPGRTDNEIKNYWNTHLSKKLISKGIDPRTHKPLNPITNFPHCDNKATSSTANDHHFSNPESNHGFSTLEEAETGHDQISIINQGNGTSDGSTMDLWGTNEDDENIDDVNYCTDDGLPSFLNSLINEDWLNSQEQQQQLSMNIAPAGSDHDLLISSAQTFPFGAGWDAPIMSSAFNHNDSRG